jgi:hypothetical protein
LALAGGAAPVSAAGLRLSDAAAPALGGGAVVVGDQRSLGRLAVANLGQQYDTSTQGLAAVAAGAVSGLAGLDLAPAPARARLSSAVGSAPTVVSLYSRVVAQAERFRIGTPLLDERLPASAGLVASSTAAASAQGAAWPRFSVPALRLPAPQGQADYLVEVAGLRRARGPAAAPR